MAPSYFGHDDWRVPSKGELKELFNNRAAIGGFNITGPYPKEYYWSDSLGMWGAWSQDFSNGFRCNVLKSYSYSVRCVRS